MSEDGSQLQTPTTVPKMNVICSFYLRNACAKGADCPFTHPTETSSASYSEGDKIRDRQPTDTPSTIANDSIAATSTIAGATITFADGATVSEIVLPADFSMLSISNIAAIASPGDLHDTLKSWAPDENIEVTAWKNDPQTSLHSAEVKVADGGRLWRANLEAKPKLQLHGLDLQVNPIFLSASDAGTNRLQLANVTCVWYSPSRTATLKYGNANRANRAVSTLREQNRELHGRRLTFEHARHSSATTYNRFSSAHTRETTHMVHVGNLDRDTSVNDLREYLQHHAPANIELGSSSHGMSKHVIQQRVEASLGRHGKLMDWVVAPQPGVAKVKAYAKFADYHEAAQATKELNGSRIDSRSTDVLRVQHVVSVKLPVSQRVLVAIRAQLDELARTSQSTSHVTIKVYDNPWKSHTQIRVSGSEKMSVARVKMQVEALLAGHVVQDGTQPLTQSFFFQAAAFPFIDEVMKTHSVVILLDRRKMILRMYGDAESVKAAQNALLTKATEINSLTKEVILDSHTLIAAMRGGFQDIVASLGKSKVKLDNTSNPKRILVSGSDNDVRVAENILRAYDSNLSEIVGGLTISDDVDSLCAVCWTPAEDPVTTTCGHTYCRECLESQAALTADFPMCCLGGSGDCNTAFALLELQRILGASTYHELLESSLTKYIRSHPKEF